MTKFLEAAIAYAKRGWYVFPCAPNAKRPQTPNGAHAATLDEATIRSWWARWPDANVAIATDPSGLVVYDVDISDGKAGRISHDQIADRLDVSLSARTRSGGLHIYYSAPPGGVARRIGIAPEGVTAKAGESGLDLLTHGYVLAPPSIVSGGAYAWYDDYTTEQIAPLPEILVRAARAPAPSQKSDDPDSEIGEGGRNAALFKIACTYRNAGLSETALRAALHADNQARCNPPLPNAEVDLIVRSAIDRAEFDRVGAHEKIVDWITSEDSDDAERSEHAGLLDDLLIGISSRKPAEPVVTYATGFDELDKLLGGGVQTRGVTVVMGAPAAGKSALALSFARYFATMRESYQPPPVLVVSTELESYECTARIASPLLDTPWRDIVRGVPTKAPLHTVVADLPIYVLDTSKITTNPSLLIAQLNKITSALHERHEQPPIVIVDYLQDLCWNVPDGATRQKVGEIVTALRVLSQAAPCAVLTISSVSRAGYGASLEAIRSQDDPLAYLPLAKETGNIEYAAAAVCYVDVPSVGYPRRGRIAVAKSRAGSAGFVGVEFDPPLGVFRACDLPAPGSHVDNDMDQAKSLIIQDVTTRPGIYTRELLVSKHTNIKSHYVKAACASLIEDEKIKLIKTLLFPVVTI